MNIHLFCLRSCQGERSKKKKEKKDNIFKKLFFMCMCFAFEKKLLFKNYSYTMMLAQLAFEKRNFVTMSYRGGQIVQLYDRSGKKTL